MSDIADDRKNDLEKYTQKLKEQKEFHDIKIAEMNSIIIETKIKVEDLKDKTYEVISTMQQDIREIMTILKQK